MSTSAKPKKASEKKVRIRSKKVPFTCRKCGGGSIVQRMTARRFITEIWSDGRVEASKPFGYGYRGSYHCEDCGHVIASKAFGGVFTNPFDLGEWLGYEAGGLEIWPDEPIETDVCDFLSTDNELKTDIGFDCPRCHREPTIIEYYRSDTPITFYENGKAVLGTSRDIIDRHSKTDQHYVCGKCGYVLYDNVLKGYDTKLLRDYRPVNPDDLMNDVMNYDNRYGRLARSNVCNYATLVEHLKKHAE